MPQIWKSSSPLLPIVLDREADVHNLLPGYGHVPSQCLLSVTYTVEVVLSLLGPLPLTAEGVVLTCHAVASAHTIAAHAAALLQQIIITLCSCARRCDVTTRHPPSYVV
jgi:tetrahydromethanopterin S-methyltransferase subunit E